MKIVINDNNYYLFYWIGSRQIQKINYTRKREAKKTKNITWIIDDGKLAAAYKKTILQVVRAKRMLKHLRKCHY